MSPELNNPVVTSSNQEDADYLRTEESPRWESVPEEDTTPTITVTLSEQDTFVNEVIVDRTQNVDFITVTVIDSEGQEVRLRFKH